MTLWEKRAEAVKSSGLVSVRGCMEQYFQQNADEVKFRIQQVMAHMRSETVMWRPYRADMPKPYLSFRMMGGQPPGTGTVTLEGDHGAWGLFATFRNDPVFAALMQHGKARIDGAYKIHPTGIEGWLSLEAPLIKP